MPKPGNHEEPLEDGDNVVRLGLLNQSSYNSVSPDQFCLSSEEKEEKWKRISVWETELTKLEQILSFTNNEDRKFVIEMNVGDIRELEMPRNTRPYNVKWDHLPDCLNEGKKVVDSADGCEGHCGLEGVWHENKDYKESLKARLAWIATYKGKAFKYNKDEDE